MFVPALLLVVAFSLVATWTEFLGSNCERDADELADLAHARRLVNSLAGAQDTLRLEMAAQHDELLAAGVVIHEYQAGMLHTKAMVLDDRFGTVGTFKLDSRSFRLNFELVAVLYDEASVERLAALLAEDLEAYRRVELEGWRQRSLSTRIKEGFARLLSPLL